MRNAYIIARHADKGMLSFVITLKQIFEFVQDYQKLVDGFKHELTLVRGSKNHAIFRDAGMDDAKVRFDKISWSMPHMNPSDDSKLNTIESKTALDIDHRMRQCDYNTVNQFTSFNW